MRTKMRNVQVDKEEGLSYVAVQSAPRRRIDMMAAIQNFLVGMAGASALMAIGAYLALTMTH